VIFGRFRHKKAESSDTDLVEDEDLTQDDPDEDDESPARALDEATDDEAAEEDTPTDDEPAAAEPADEWEALDAGKDWREDGPFDISEVDLEADEVERLDFGCVVLTPFEGMQMQLQVDQQTRRVQAALVKAGPSAIEVALFAAPAHTSTLGQIRDEMSAATEKAGGTVTLVEGPFGTEVRRVIPLNDPKGNRVYHVSRTWFAQGPKWLLRGVVMGDAAQAEGIDGPSELLYEFFSNTVVRRDNEPRVPGDLIPMTLPKSLATSVPGGDGDAEAPTADAQD